MSAKKTITRLTAAALMAGVTFASVSAVAQFGDFLKNSVLGNVPYGRQIGAVGDAAQALSLTSEQAERLRTAVVTVLRRAIDLRGSSIRNYVGGSGLQGAMQNEFRVYGRTGEPCLHCATPIERIVLAGRSTHFCVRCQKKR